VVTSAEEDHALLEGFCFGVKVEAHVIRQGF
jgi:hypothetical protein